MDQTETAGGEEAPLTALPCTIQDAVYTIAGEKAWEISFTQPKIRPSAASDLLLMVTGSAFVRDFSFEASQGFGGTYLQVTVDDAELGQSMPAEDQPDDPIAFHGFAQNQAGGLVRLPDAPQSGDMAPVAIYIPDVSKYFWYDEKYTDIETGETLDEPVALPQGLFMGSCLK
ncbi:hypothetical protein ACFOWX_04135 [Sphingorhabdus arenilitoris]|uniref:Uncharacterized protein n=1 Tax=Sphingorhabdus arenilitoris TaxID=1490041 RepID=A0ABV8REF9_9SPHN